MIRFRNIVGMIICIDAVMNITSVFNKLIQVSILEIFGLKMHDIDMYTSIYASIAVLLSSNIKVVKKLEYSIGLIIAYIGIFTFIMACNIIYPYSSLYLTLIVFITMAFPILLWIMLDDKQYKRITGDIRKHGTRR